MDCANTTLLCLLIMLAALCPVSPWQCIRISKLKEARKEDKHFTYTKISAINNETYEYILLATFHKTTKIQVQKNTPHQWRDCGYEKKQN
jgi:hypothetical protein